MMVHFMHGKVRKADLTPAQIIMLQTFLQKDRCEHILKINIGSGGIGNRFEKCRKSFHVAVSNIT